MELIAPDPDVIDPANSKIVAEVFWTVSSRPPEVVLTFEGLHEPVGLWERLIAIGWQVPGMPPRPANAIEWIPDPVAGTDFTVLPWDVTDHKLHEGAWTVDEEQVGTLTLDALLDFKSTIVGSSSQITDHERDYAQRQEAAQQVASNPIAVVPEPDLVPAPVPEPVPERISATPVEASANKWAASIANPAAIGASAATIGADRPVAPAPVAPEPEAETGSRFILLLNFPVANDPLPGAGNWMGVSGLSKTQSEWSELSLDQGQPVPGHEQMEHTIATGGGAWFADTDEPLEETAPARLRLVRLFLPNLSVDDAKVRRMNKLLGENIESHQLRPLLGGDGSAVLVSAAVAANSFEMLKSNLCLRMPKAIIRIPS